MTNLSDLGNFQLGSVQLGAVQHTMTHFESLSFSDSSEISLTAIMTEAALTFADSENIEFDAAFQEVLTFFEHVWYPAFYQAGILGRIVNPIDITSEGFCNAVLQTGQSIELNDVPERAFLQVKQRIQTFDNEIKIYPGDAVMYTCPALVIAAGDVVLHNFIEYTIFTWIDRFFGGNLIFRKVALRRKEIFNLPMPKVLGLSASANLEGKTTLTWEDVDKNVYPSFDHFNIYRGIITGGPYTFIKSTTSNSFTDKNLVPNAEYFYIVKAVDKFGFEGVASDEAVTPIDNTKPETPKGGR